MPTRLLEKSAREYVPNMLADQIVDEVLKDELLPDQLHKVGRHVRDFHRDQLPSELQQLVTTPTISSSKLVQALFAEELRTNIGWCSARTLYANTMFEIVRGGETIAVGANDPVQKQALREKLTGNAEVIVRVLLGHPARVKDFPLPQSLISFLVHTDKRLHMALMQNEKTRNFTTTQMRDARMALQKQLLVTYLLQPMLSNLAPSKPQQQEIWFLGLLLSNMLKALPSLSNEVLGLSYADSPKQFQEAVTRKDTAERLQNIKETRKANLKSNRSGHQRSRSADTRPIDPRSLPKREDMMNYRAKKRTESLLQKIEQETSHFEEVLADTKRNVEEHEVIRKAQADLRDFNLDELDEVLSILGERDINASDVSLGTLTVTTTAATTTTTTTQMLAPTVTTTTTTPRLTPTIAVAANAVRTETSAAPTEAPATTPAKDI